MRFPLLFVLVTAPALFFLLNVANANIEEEGIGGEKEGVVSLETRLEFAEEAEREIESDVVFPAEASDDDFDIKDDDEDISLLYAQITEDLKPFLKNKVTREMTNRARVKYGTENHRAFGFVWVKNELFLATRRPSREFNGHHVQLMYEYFYDLCEVFGKTKTREEDGKSSSEDCLLYTSPSPRD